MDPFLGLNFDKKFFVTLQKKIRWGWSQDLVWQMSHFFNPPLSVIIQVFFLQTPLLANPGYRLKSKLILFSHFSLFIIIFRGPLTYTWSTQTSKLNIINKKHSLKNAVFYCILLVPKYQFLSWKDNLITFK